MIVEGIFKDLPEDRVAYWEKRCREVGANAPGNYKGAVVKPDGYFLQQMPEEFARWLALMETVYYFHEYGMYTYLGIGLASCGDIRLVDEACRESSKALKLIGIDMPSHGKERFQRLQKWISEEKDPSSHFCAREVFVGNSHSKEAADWLSATMQLPRCIAELGRTTGMSFVAAFLDGDHREEGVYQDFGLVEPYCAHDTYVGVHDVVAPHVKGGVQRAIDRVVKEGRFKQVGYVEQEGEDHPCGLAVLQRSM